MKSIALTHTTTNYTIGPLGLVFSTFETTKILTYDLFFDETTSLIFDLSKEFS